MTEDELLAEIIAAIETGKDGPENEPNTLTTPELAERLGCSQKKALSHLKALAVEGKVKPDRIGRVNFWGVVTNVQGWRLIKE